MTVRSLGPRYFALGLKRAYNILRLYLYDLGRLTSFCQVKIVLYEFEVLNEKLKGKI